MARDISAEILAKLNRQRENNEYLAIESLIHACQGENYNKEFLKYIPIVAAAYIESNMRSNIANLIDYGIPYNENLKNLSDKDLKLDFDILNKIQTKKYSLGHFVSHVLSFSSYKDIDSKFTTILGYKFTDNLLKEFKTSKFEDNNINAQQFIENTNNIIADIEKMFELRHIIAHEFPSQQMIKEKIIQYLDSCNIFVNHANYSIWRLIEPIELYTQSEMNNYAYEQYEKAKNELDEIIYQIKDIMKPRLRFAQSGNEVPETDIDITLFDKSMEYWWQYTETSAQAHCKKYEQGTIYQSLYYPHITNLINEKIASLQRQFKYYFDRYKK